MPMEFKPILPKRVADAVPSLTITDKTLCLNIPPHISTPLGIAPGAKVQLGMNKHGRALYVGITPHAGGNWKVADRKNVHMIYAEELRPKKQPAKTRYDLQFKTEGEYLVLTMPEGWELPQTVTA